MPTLRIPILLFLVLVIAVVSASRHAADPARAAGFVTVTSTGDDNDGFCGNSPGDCTLREAILIADEFSLDEILFAIPGAGPHLISLTSLLPAIAEAVTIDGLSQPGASCGPARSILIAITDGNNLAEGLRLEGSSSVVRGLSVTGFDIDVVLTGSGQHTIACSNLGVNPAGTGRDTSFPAVRVESDGNIIGGAEGATNLIGGSAGIELKADTDGADLSFNRIGRRMNDTDIDVSAYAGVTITGAGSGNTIRQNIFGTFDYGVVSQAAPQSSLLVEGNVFTETPRYAVWLAGQDGGPITIFDNQFLGSQQPDVSAVRLLGNHAETVIRGNVFNGTRTGVDADVTDGPEIGGNGPGDRNEFIANETAIDLYNSGFNPSAQSSIVNNSIAGGEGPAAYADRRGIRVGNRHSGSLLIANNEITGADLAGIDLKSVSNTSISNNRIGVDSADVIAPNGFGIRVLGSGVTGPITIDTGNIIAGNATAGISVTGSTNVSIHSNFIGTISANALPIVEFGLQPAGVVIAESTTVTVDSNRVQYNGGPGISVLNSAGTAVTRNTVADNSGPGMVVTATRPGFTGNQVSSNSLISNGGAGVIVQGPINVAMDINSYTSNGGPSIDLEGDGYTLNDPLDADVGANGLMNAPTLTWAQAASGSFTVTGSIQTTPGLVGFVDIYVASQCGVGGHGQGRYQQYTGITADAGGLAQFSSTGSATGDAQPGSYVSAVLRSPNDFTTGLSSEFSNCVRIVSEAAPNLNLLSTNSANAGGGGFALRIGGENFSAGAIAFFNGQARPTIVLSETEVVMQLSAADLATPGTATVSVRNPSTADAPAVPEVSNPLPFAVRTSPSADVNCSGGVDGLDAAGLLRALAGLGSTVCDGDATLDGAITIADVVHIRLVAAGLLPE